MPKMKSTAVVKINSARGESPCVRTLITMTPMSENVTYGSILPTMI
jgi:hypothetical protein